MPDQPLAADDVEAIQGQIRVVRGLRVILAADLARLYGVPTKRLNEQVRRNPRKFPEDFMFRLTRDEARDLTRLRSQNATLRQGQHIKHLPYAFTEHGAIQAANVLNSDAAVEMSVRVVRAFNQLRQMFATHRALAAKLTELENRIGAHDEHIGAIIATIRQLTADDTTRRRRRIGFRPD